MPRARKLHLDPVKYETFFHRLWAIGEEGRSSIQGSPPRLLYRKAANAWHRSIPQKAR